MSVASALSAGMTATKTHAIIASTATAARSLPLLLFITFAFIGAYDKFFLTPLISIIKDFVL
ncbi:MAG: hypothetical protein A3205_04520 [Methanomassiliicoccales archaeon Mx-03]|nr:MAG: hypothetical protein A3205_04520 [Methanomassiliicoccales archaeon Mx-03]